MKSPTRTSVKIGRRLQSLCVSSAVMGLSAALQHAIEISQPLSCWLYVLLPTIARTMASSSSVSGSANSSAE
eukprot:8309922-Pyramimonas_sp.AAC.1